AAERPPSPRRAPNRRRARPWSQGTRAAKCREGGRSPPHHAPTSPDVPRPCEPGQARWVPCEPSDARRLGSTRAPFHMVLVLHGYAAHERRRALGFTLAAISRPAHTP